MDALAPQRVGEQGVRRAIGLGRRDDAFAPIGERQNGVGCLAGCHCKRRSRAFELRDPLLQYPWSDWRSGCSKTLDFQIEQRRALVRALEFVGDVPVDGRRNRFGRGVASNAYVWKSLLCACASSECLRQEAKELNDEVMNCEILAPKRYCFQLPRRMSLRLGWRIWRIHSSAAQGSQSGSARSGGR